MMGEFERGAYVLMPEHELWIQVLMTFVSDVLERSRRSPTESKEVFEQRKKERQEQVYRSADTKHIETVCDMISIDHQYFLKLLRQIMADGKIVISTRRKYSSSLEIKHSHSIITAQLMRMEREQICQTEANKSKS